MHERGPRHTRKITLIAFFLCGALGKAEHLTNRLIRAVIMLHVAFGAVPSGVPRTALPSCFSFSRRWHIFSVAESACCVSTFQLVTLAATCFAHFPPFLKSCVLYDCGFSWSGRICCTCMRAGCACVHELVLLGLPFTKSKGCHNFLF
jgi:hypothetical protein